MRSLLLLAVAIAIAASACATARPAPLLRPQVEIGPGARTPSRRVLVLSASCGSMEFRCPREYTDSVDGIVRSQLDFAGYALIDPETLRNRTRERHETHEETTERTASSSRTDDKPNLAPDRTTLHSEQSVSETEHHRVDLDGPGFADLTVGERRALLAEAGADSVLVVRVVVGAEQGGWSPDQNTEVMVKLAVDAGDTMAWASRCIASSGDYASVSAALESAARCAIQGAPAAR
jgi:hypothetical protein